MKKIFLILSTLFIFEHLTYGQERFFILTDRWMTSSAVEFDEYYAIIGTGFTPDYANKITITKINKMGESIDTWDIAVNDAIASETKNQQSLSCYNQQKIMGITVINESESLIKARRLFLNNDLTTVTDGSWQYTPPQGDEAIMFVTHREQANTIVHGLNYHDGNTVNSTLVSTDTLGNVIWESNFSCGGTYCWMEPRHIHAAHDGGYIFTNNERRGFAEGGIVGELDIGTIIKTDSLGVQQWRIRPGGMGEPYDSGYILLQPTDDGNYLCVWADNFWRTSDGTTFDHYNLNPNATMWFAKIDPNGNKIWEKNIQEQIDEWGVDGSAYFNMQMLRTSDNNFVIIGNNRLFKVNQEGNIIWTREYNPLNLVFSYEQIYFYRMHGINETSDGGFIIAGEFEAREGTDFPEFVQTGFALKVDEYGCLEADCHLDDPIVSVVSPQLSIKAMSIYPNPASGAVMLSYDIGQSASRLSFSVTDVTGRVVHEQALTGIVGTVQVDTHKWASGVYLCRVLVDGYVGGVRRVVITH